MPSSAGFNFDALRRRASQGGLAFLLLSPLVFMRSLEDAYVLPQRGLALLGLSLCFAAAPAWSFNRSRVLLAALAFFAWRLLTHGLAPGAGFSFPWMVEQMVPLGTLVLVAHAARLADFERDLLRLALLGVTLVSAYALIALWGLDPLEQGALDLGFLKRAHGSLGNPDFLAGFLVLALPGSALAWLALPDQANRMLWLRGMLFFLLALTLLLTHVRGAWLAAALALPVALYCGRRQIQVRRLWVLLVLVLGLAAAFSSPGRHNPTGQSPWARLQQSWSGDGAWSGRRFMAQAAWNLARAHPVLGTGPGHFQNSYLEEQGRLLNQSQHSAEPYRFTADIHNDWLQVLAESGWIGWGLFLAIFALALRAAWCRASMAGNAVVGLFAAFGVQAFFHFPLGIQASALFFWGAVGLAAAWEDEPKEPSLSGWTWLTVPLVLGLGVTLDQARASAALNAGTVLKDQSRFSEAVAPLEKATRLWRQDPRAWVRLGLAQDALGSGDDPVRSFTQATRLLPGLPEAWSNLGLVLGKLGRLTEAQAATERALALNPRAGEAWSNLAKLRYLQGDSQGAIAHLQSGLNQAGPSALLYFNLGAVYVNTGQHQRAREAFEQCLRLQPDYPEAQRLLRDLRHAR